MDNVNVEFENGLSFIHGESGSGKSTLLSILGLLQTPTSGQVYIDDVLIDFHNKKQINELLKHQISFVFQDFNIIEDTSVLNNLSLINDNLDEINQVLDIVGLKDKLKTPTKMLSGGEKQRLAIGRALLKGGNILLLDEPTGNLDEENTKTVFDLLKSLGQSKTIIVVSHDLDSVYQYGDKVYVLEDGKVSRCILLDENEYEMSVDDDFAIFDDILETLSHNLKQCDGKIIINNKDKYLVQFDNYASKIYQIFNLYHKKKITLKIVYDRVDSGLKTVFDVHPKRHFLDFKFQMSYMLSLFKGKLLSNIATSIMLILNFLISFILVTFLTYDVGFAVQNGAKTNNINFSPVGEAELMENTRKEYVYCGKELYDSLLEIVDEKDVIPYFVSSYQNAYLDNDIPLYVFVIDSPIRFLDHKIALPSLNSVGISKYLYQFSTPKNLVMSFKYNGSSINNNLEFAIEDIYDFNAKSMMIDDYNNSRLDNPMYMPNIYNQLCVFISKETFNNIVVNNPISIKGDILNKDATLTEYANREGQYFPYKNEELIFGIAPATESEIVVGKNLLDNLGIDDYKEIINQEFTIKDIHEIKQYAGDINLYDYHSKFKVVGVVDESYYIYVTQELYDSIAEQVIYSIGGFMLNAFQSSTAHNRLYHDYSIQLLFPMLSSCYSVVDFVNALSYFIYIFLALVIVLTALLIASTYINNVYRRYKEAAIFKSFGENDSRIFTLFLSLNGLIISISIGASLAIVNLGLLGLNNFARKFFVGNINFDVFGQSPLAYACFIILGMSMTLVSTFIALNKLKKMDPYLTIKRGNN